MKRIHLWFIIGAALSAACMAQPSYTVTAFPGYTAIANQLDNGGNTLNEVLPSVPSGSHLLKWDCQTWQSYTYQGLSHTWMPNGTLAPGEGALFYNPSSVSVNLTFVGTPHVPVLPAVLPCGCGNWNFLSCQTNEVGTYENITGQLPAEGASFARFDPLLQDWVTNIFSGGAWSLGVPTANVGESVWLKVPCETNLYKWNQPPATGGGPTNIYTGWNQESTYNMPPIAADDWVCTSTNPVTKIVWWGSFYGWTYSNPPVLPQGFQIRFWSDVPKGADPTYPDFSHPAGGLVTAPIYVTNVLWSYYGQDHDPRDGSYEACFRFEKTLSPDQWFYQSNWPTGTNIYWISIEADMSNTPEYIWGWKTRPYTNSAPDAAVMFDPNVPWYAPLTFPTPNDLWDLAFELHYASASVSSKYQQPPDLTWNGIDVNATSNSPSYKFLLADDFPCTSTGPITNITIWGSWENDYPPQNNPANVIFTLSLHTNVPPGTKPWSMPGTMKFKKTYTPGQFTCTVEQAGIDEWWMEPPTTGWFPGDHTCYRYDFPNPGFTQQGTPASPAIYWLDVQAQLPPGMSSAPFGWKTSANHWMDAATWVAANETYNGNGWLNLTYPPEHPLYGQNIDLAFRINSVSTPFDIPKWLQPPVPETGTNHFNGWDQYSVYGGTNIVADDWVCTNATPVTDIHWWGSFIGWTEDHPPGIVPNGFVISIWTDVPKGPGVPFSHPGICQSNIYITTFAPTFVGWDYDPRNPGANPDACFKFEQDLTPDQWFHQAPGTNIYWISIAAQYPPGAVPDYPWGWKTRPRATNSLAPDDAVRIFGPTAPLPGSPYQMGTNIWWPTTNSSWDMAFALTTSTNQCPPPTINCTNLTVQCGSLVSPPYAYDNCCNSNLTPVRVWSQTNGACPWLITETWLATDCQGQTNTCTRLVTITDTLPPVLTCASNKTVQCGSTWSFGTPSASDVCCGTNVTIIIDYTATNGSCPWIITRQWKAFDCCSNSAICSQTITMVDTNAPIITCASNKTVQCGLAWSFDPPTASDVCCGTNVIVSILSTITNGYCPWNIIRTWKATDCCSNTATCSQTVTLVDTNPPIITCASNKTVGCGWNGTFDWPSASDVCCGTNVSLGLVSVVNNGAYPVTVTATWRATDCCSNFAYCSQSVTVADTNVVKYVQPPNLTNGLDVSAEQAILADDFVCTNTGPITDIHLWCSWLGDGMDPTASIWLGVYDDVPATNSVPSHPGALKWAQWFSPGQYVPGHYAFGLEEFYEPGQGVMGVDSNMFYYCFYPTTNVFVQQGSPAQPRVYWLAVFCNASSGYFGWKTSALQQHDVAVYGDGVIWNPLHNPIGTPLDLAFKITTSTNQCPPPTIICSNLTVQCGTVEPPPYAWDNCCNAALTPVLAWSQTNSSPCPWVITEVWKATDCYGQTNACTRVVTIVDTLPPVLTCASNKTVQCGLAWGFDSPTVSDLCCGTNVTVSIQSTVTNGQCPWTIIRTWKATDCCSNTATCSQTVIMQDTNPPIITCASNKTVQCGFAWGFDPPTVSDLCCGTNVTVSILSTVTNGQCPWFITRSWKATDCCSNTATCSQTVTVIDTLPPVITCASNKTVGCGWNGAFDWPTASDLCCGTNVSIGLLSVVNNGAYPVTVTATWRATDCCGNYAYCSQSVTVADTNAVKYVQPPNLTNGVDVWASDSLVLADDFVCTNSGPITDIHLWCSWWFDMMDPNAAIWLGIYDDVPEANGVPSHPGNLKWGEWFGPGQYVRGLYATGFEEFYDPFSLYTIGTDTNMYYYCFYPTNAFVQQGSPQQPRIYWLAVHGYTSSGQYFGWKTSAAQQHDAATWTGWPGGPPSGGWEPIYDPYNAMPLDLAFKITTTVTNPPPCCPETNGVKHVQHPDLLNGMDINATFWPLDPWEGLSWVLADDFPCTNTGPVTDIHLWGSWLNDYVDLSATFTLTIWSDEPAWWQPGVPLWSQTYSNGQYALCFYTNRTEAFQNPFADPLGNSSTLYYLCFDVNLTNAFRQTGSPTAPTNYWLSVAVQFPGTAQRYFGWKTSANAYRDCAVFSTLGLWPPPGGWEPLSDWFGVPIDLAFKITTATNECPPPTLICSNLTVQCGTVEPPPYAWDNCCNAALTPTLVWSQTNSAPCPWVITEVWLATDCRGQTNTCTRVVTVVDTTPPIVTTLCVTNVLTIGTTNDDFATPEPAYPSTALAGRLVRDYGAKLKGFDDCTVNKMVAHTFANLPSCITAAKLTVRVKPCGDIPNNDTMELSFTDSNTNRLASWGRFFGSGQAEAGLLPNPWSSYASYVFTLDLSALPLAAGGTTNFLGWLNQYGFLDFICEDDSAVDYLILTVTCCQCATNKIVECGRAWAFDQPTAWDACCGTNVTISVLSTTTNGFCPWNFTRVWQLADCCSNYTYCCQTVIMVDTTPPVITCASNKTVQCGSVWSFDSPTASDTCCGTNVTITIMGTVTNGQCPWLITRTWMATDCCTNSATCSQMVTMQDTTPPVITCAGNKTVQCGSVWSFDIPTASDTCCGTNVTITIVGTVTNGQCPWLITRTWKATDCCTNSATCSQMVTVQDTTPPVITCAGNKTVQCGSVWSFDTPTASDTCCGTNVTITIVGTVTNGQCPWLVTRTWKATDCCTNSATCSQMVTVVDVTPPTLICAPNKTVVAGWPWSFDTPFVSDICCGTNITVNILSTVTNSPCPLTVTRTWNAVDCCTNVAQPCTQTVTVVNTNLPPGDSNVVKFVQWPKLYGGYDVYDRTNIFLADDFRCTRTGAISDIHIWCSYLNDMVANPPMWLGIYSDVPATGNTNSHPGQLLWQQTFMPGQYESYFWDCGAEQWWDPSSHRFYGTDSQVLYYVFYPSIPFAQQGTPQNPITYWLAVHCLDSSFFGWKTSTNAYQDAAVWAAWTDDPGGTNTWTSMTDPNFGGPLNMAFEITTEGPPPPLIKFTQPPDLSPNGFDVRALRPKILADDFLCTKTGPITNIHLWASWLEDGWDTNAFFQLGFWSDVPITAGLGPNLLANGTFESAFADAGLSGPLDGFADAIPPGWNRQETFSGGGTEYSHIGPIADNGRSAPGSQAVRFSRSLGGRSGDWTAIYQNLAINAGLYTHLYLTMDVKVWSHDLEAGGTVNPAFEWPAVVEVDYVDTTGHNRVWRHGWYLDPPGDGSRINDPGQDLIPFYNDTLVPQGVWVPNNFDLLAELPQVQTINRILVGGSGWNFSSEVDNVAIRPPLNSTNAFSRPGNLLWTGYFAPSQYSYTWYLTNEQQYYDPNLGGNGILGFDNIVWEYDFPVQTNMAFVQTNGHVYWLSVSVNSQEYFGWKTAANRWNDDAVFGHVDNGWNPLRDWQELFAPPELTRSLDLAFSLTTVGMRVHPPVITNIWVTNTVTGGVASQVIGLEWSLWPYQDAVRYRVFSAPDLGQRSDGADIFWTPCSPEIPPPNHFYCETNALPSQRFYRVLAIDP